jgi:hypothetical protein
MSVDLHEVAQRIRAVEAANAAYGASAWQDGEDFDARRARRELALDALKAKLEPLGAVFSEKPPHDYRFRLAGIRSTSTSGYSGAVGNWLAAARRRIEARP